MKTITKLVAIALATVALGLTACQSIGQGPISQQVTGFGAALLMALDALLATGVLTPEQYLPMATAVKGMGDTVATALQTVQDVKQQMSAAEASRWTPAEIVAAGTAAVGAATAGGAKLASVLRDRSYTPEELAERKIKRIRAAAAKRVA